MYLFLLMKDALFHFIYSFELCCVPLKGFWTFDGPRSYDSNARPGAQRPIRLKWLAGM